MNIDPRAAIVSERRDAVAPLAVRRLSLRQIVKALAELGHRNPKTKQPWEKDTINRDLKVLDEQWRRSYVDKLDSAKGHALAQVREVQRQGWLASDYRLVLQAVKQECELLGLDAPQRVDVVKRLEMIAQKEGWPLEDVMAEAERALEELGG